MYNRKHIHVIDLVRFFAASVVALFHITYSSWISESSGARSFIFDGYSFPSIGSFFQFGWIGVEVFFVISGFVIAKTACHTTPWRYIRSRFLRLYPTVWICASFTLPFVLLAGGYGETSTVERYLRSLVIFPLHPWIDPAYWTLPVELSFYFLVFVFVVLGGAKNLHRLAIALLLISGFYQLGLTLQKLSVVPWDTHLPLQVSRLLMLDFGAFFALGIFLCQQHSNDTSGAGLTRLTNISALVCVVEIINHMIKANRLSNVTELGTVLTIAACVAVWGTCILIIAFGAQLNSLAIFKSESSVKIVRILGLMTFPLYLLHFVIGVSLVRILQSDFGLHKLAALGISLTSIYFLAFLICVYLEPPIRLLVGAKMDLLYNKFASQFDNAAQ